MVCFFSRLYGDETLKSSTLWRSIDIMPHVYQGFPPIWLFNDCLHTYLSIFYRPLWIILRRVKWFDFSVSTIEVKHQTHRYADGQSASRPNALSKMFWFFSQYYGVEISNSLVIGLLVGIRPHVHQGFLPIWLLNDCLHTYLWIFYRPLWIIPRRVKWFEFSVGTMEVKHQTHRLLFVKKCPLFGAP